MIDPSQFFEMLQKMTECSKCDECEEKELVEVGELSPSEMEEHRAIKIQCNDLQQKQKQLVRDIGILKARNKLFWAKIEDRLKKEDSDLIIDDDKIFEKVCDC